MNKLTVLLNCILLFLATGCNTVPEKSHERFTVQNAVVIDEQTQLMWSRCLLGTQWNGSHCAGKPKQYSWAQIHDVVKTLDYAGYNDWRVPTLDELKSLAVSQSTPPQLEIFYLDDTIFAMPDCQGTKTNAGTGHNGHWCWHWTDSPIAGSGHYAWILYFGYGYGSANYEADRFPLRIVRKSNPKPD